MRCKLQTPSLWHQLVAASTDDETWPLGSVRWQDHRMGQRLADKVALVTGSTRGIGRAIATRFAREGAAVVVTGRTETTGHAVQEEIRAAGGEATYVRADIGREADVEHAIAAAVQRYGGLTTLVNNAAPTDLVGPGRGDRSLADITDDAWDAIMTVGLKQLVWCTRHAAAHLAAADGASIVNISSAAAMRGVPGIDAYTAAKGAMNALTRSLAVELAGDGVRVNAIVCGMVLTSEGAFKMMDHPVIGPATRALHLTRLGLPDDIANVALFLASDEAAFVTGVNLPADGGALAKMAVPDISAADLQLD
jgi:NAD(P)-dependent dehydrogenase (short-subunit alcohol dehydrogenase family)